MKLHKYAEDPLVKKLNELSAAASPGRWSSVSMGSFNDHDAAFAAELVNAWRDGRLYAIASAEGGV